MKITVDTAKLVKRLTKTQSVFSSSNIRKFLNELGEIGLQEAVHIFANADYDGANDVSVELEAGDNSVSLVASGETVLFIEFGTGITYSEKSPYDDVVHYERGTYGQGKGKQTSWIYYGQAGTNGRVIGENDIGQIVKTQGNPPANAMYGASKEMKQRIIETARKCFT